MLVAWRIQKTDLENNGRHGCYRDLSLLWPTLTSQPATLHQHILQAGGSEAYAINIQVKRYHVCHHASLASLCQVNYTEVMENSPRDGGNFSTEDFHLSGYYYIPPQHLLPYINQTKMLVTSTGYH